MKTYRELNELKPAEVVVKNDWYFSIVNESKRPVSDKIGPFFNPQEAVGFAKYFMGFRGFLADKHSWELYEVPR